MRQGGADRSFDKLKALSQSKGSAAAHRAGDECEASAVHPDQRGRAKVENQRDGRIIGDLVAFALDAPHPAPQKLGLVATPSKHDAKTIDQAIARVASAIAERHTKSPHLLLLGIANGGMILARRLAERLQKSGLKPGLGTIDISFHRDDIGHHPIPKEFSPTSIPHDVNGATVILVDDVLYSGRTVKAALAELFDHGRPAAVELAVLVDRGGRKLPIAADYCGLSVTASDAEKVVVVLNDPPSAADAVTVLAPARSK